MQGEFFNIYPRDLRDWPSWTRLQREARMRSQRDGGKSVFRGFVVSWLHFRDAIAA
jgi:hypothetical protein